MDKLKRVFGAFIMGFVFIVVCCVVVAGCSGAIVFIIKIIDMMMSTSPMFIKIMALCFIIAILYGIACAIKEFMKKDSEENK